MRFSSPTYGTCDNISIVVENIFKKISTNKTAEWIIAIGTDSQNRRDMTKFCRAILILEKGKGGSYFYSTHEEKRVHVVPMRMLREAELSINLGKEIIEEIENVLLSDEWIEDDLSISFEIHCDLGHDGKSRDSISAAIGWIASEFGELVVPKIKPESFAASTIADKYTK